MGFTGSAFTPAPTDGSPIRSGRRFRTHQRAFAGILAWANAGLVVGQGAGARRTDCPGVSGDFFAVLGLTPARGRLLAARDDSLGLQRQCRGGEL